MYIIISSTILKNKEIKSLPYEKKLIKVLYCCYIFLFALYEYKMFNINIKYIFLRSNIFFLNYKIYLIILYFSL